MLINNSDLWQKLAHRINVYKVEVIFFYIYMKFFYVFVLNYHAQQEYNLQKVQIGWHMHY